MTQISPFTSTGSQNEIFLVCEELPHCGLGMRFAFEISPPPPVLSIVRLRQNATNVTVSP